MRPQTKPSGLRANGLWNIFTGRKRYTIKCGRCSHSFSDKVPFNTGDLASSICPACGAQNTWSHSEFNAWYDAHMKAQNV